MSDDAKDSGLAALISSIFAPSATTPPAPETPQTLQEKPVTAAAPPAKPVAPLSADGPDGKRARLPAVAIADLVLGELRKVDGFPKSGVSITVYGSRPWNAMIRFAPFSTTSQDATRLRRALPDIVFRLRQYVDLEN
ncbi:hypothetical protein JQ596_28620 [Bradyrhizobium manausense]|uniref:hypothetical protein n=1 Tax=Bradyrhizobium TaxID=374 RepID=UPI001BA7B658|nr:MULTISPECIES: hypothetical protein [Bradyrhizobium]MBR0829506.1 hypothetical protein [Bradyrhizobium manausense]UVO25877.1 hypothetical protein KUF59_25260 [Bradyrhizobium arachidis]